MGADAQEIGGSMEIIIRLDPATGQVQFKSNVGNKIAMLGALDVVKHAILNPPPKKDLSVTAAREEQFPPGFLNGKG